MPHYLKKIQSYYIMYRIVNWLKFLSFGGLFLLIAMMIMATVLEKFHGSAWTSIYFYGSPLFIGLWWTVSLSSICYLTKRKLWKKPATFLLHISFILILTGAFTTHVYGIQGRVHLRCNEPPSDTFVTDDGQSRNLPFRIRLLTFKAESYMGSFAPTDYVSTLQITDQENSFETQVSMNRICRYKHYRFYQSGYDSDQKGSTLLVSYDPWGIGITYTGYAIMLLAFLVFPFDSRSRFRQLLKLNPLSVKSFILFGSFTLFSQAVQARPQSLPEESAAELGKLYVYYNDRICPLQTFARDFTTKLYGKQTYKGLNAEQILAGWLFFYDDWKNEPMIRIKNDNVRQLLQTDKGYVALTDFINEKGYKLNESLNLTGNRKERNAIEKANEKFSLVTAVCTGQAIKLFPYQSGHDKFPIWYALTDNLPDDIPKEQWGFIHYSLSFVAEAIARNDQKEVVNLLKKIRKYQQNEAAGVLPSPTRFKAELWYNQINSSRSVAIPAILIGLVAFFFYSKRLSLQKQSPASATPVLVCGLTLIWCYLTAVITLRGFISGHFPLSNGYETMQFMAVTAVTAGIVIRRRFEIAISFAYLTCGLTLMVAMMGESDPSVTPLMPVLSSPLLSIHVMVIMMAYVLLMFTMLNGLTACILRHTGKDHTDSINRLYQISSVILYPATFLLATGIFVGAIWANISWGRYWGWDPKEVWALITLLIYSTALHTGSFKSFARPMFFHIYMVVAFLSVLITYFGVNFLLGGLHSYAG